MKVSIIKVENGWILELTKINYLSGRQPETEVYIFSELQEALDKIKESA